MVTLQHYWFTPSTIWFSQYYWLLPVPLATPSTTDSSQYFSVYRLVRGLDPFRGTSPLLPLHTRCTSTNEPVHWRPPPVSARVALALAVLLEVLSPGHVVRGGAQGAAAEHTQAEAQQHQGRVLLTVQRLQSGWGWVGVRVGVGGGQWEHCYATSRARLGSLKQACGWRVAMLSRAMIPAMLCNTLLCYVMLRHARLC